MKIPMHRFLLLLASVAMAPALAAGPVQEPELPAALKSEPPFIQNRVCGELMANMARMSADLHVASRSPKMREAAIMAGTRAMVFVKANAAISKDEADRAKRIATQLEGGASAAKPGIVAYQFCETRVARWLKEGVVTAADFTTTQAQVQQALDAALSAPGKTTVRR